LPLVSTEVSRAIGSSRTVLAIAGFLEILLYIWKLLVEVASGNS
jgi:hypothetical protein